MNRSLRIIFMGTPDFAVPSLKALVKEGYEIITVITQPDRPKGRGQKLSASPVKEEALRLGLTVIQPEKINTQEVIKEIRLLNPDLIVVVAFGQILPLEILSLPPLGCINVHASLLPRYRGAAPIHWAIIQGEKESGLTTMLMDQGLDTGDMLLNEKVSILKDMTSGELHDLLALKGAILLIKTIKLWQQGQIKPVSQKELPSSYAPLLKREHELIHWEQPVEQIHNQIRGLNPWPGAYTHFAESILKIWEAKIYTLNDSGQEPGTVTFCIKGQGFVVQTGQGQLLVTQVQPMGKKRISAESFINGYHLEVGYAFIR